MQCDWKKSRKSATGHVAGVRSAVASQLRREKASIFPSASVDNVRYFPPPHRGYGHPCTKPVPFSEYSRFARQTGLNWFRSHSGMVQDQELFLRVFLLSRKKSRPAVAIRLAVFASIQASSELSRWSSCSRLRSVPQRGAPRLAEHSRGSSSGIFPCAKKNGLGGSELGSTRQPQ